MRTISVIKTIETNLCNVCNNPLYYVGADDKGDLCDCPENGLIAIAMRVASTDARVHATKEKIKIMQEKVQMTEALLRTLKIAQGLIEKLVLAIPVQEDEIDGE